MLRRRSIRLRIIVLVLVPVIALIGLYGVVLNLTLGDLLTLRRQAAIRTDIALPVAHVQTQLAYERTIALQYLARPGSDNLTKLLHQERMTDSAIRQFRSAAQKALRSGPVPAEAAALEHWQAHLSAMNGLRAQVISAGMTIYDAADAYSKKLSEGNDVLNQAIIPVLTGPIGIQAIDVLNMARVSQDLGEESDVLRADLLANKFPQSDVQLVNQLVIQHQEQSFQTVDDLEQPLRGYFDLLAHTKPAIAIRAMEADILGPGGPSAVPLAAWTNAETLYQQDFLRVLLHCARTLASQALAMAHQLVRNLILIAGLGLLAIAIAIGIGLLLGRSLIRQLNDLRQSAVELSSEQLPSAIERLRAGEDVDVRSEVPELRPSSDEIGQVRQAFNTAARTAIAAAVDEVRIRHGVNDVFRNLARRNQSLLTRQLELLDGMERRVHDPEELADLFRIDHLTTRMRRHAEGLLIVAGGSSGRIWREPVPLVDVMRAAVAEVEDYTRIRVTSRSDTLVAGHAVADIIHLLAELVENAATFSPGSTPVRVDGDRVARGVIVEIEDRGLGMSEGQLAEINATLAQPPLFDLSGSDQLGLFITGQLAKRHDIKVTLRGSAYGGITAVVLIPAALTAEGAGGSAQPAIANIRELGGRPVALPGGPAEPSQAIVVAAAAAAAAAAGVATAVQHEDARLTGQPVAFAPGGEAPLDVDSPLPTRQPGSTGQIWTQGRVVEYSSRPASVMPAALTDSERAAPNLADLDGLPIRVRQASLAPQLRHESVVVQAEQVTVDPEPSPEAARNTMAALQQGWQRGRSVSEPITDEFSAIPGTQRPGNSFDEGSGGSV